MIVTSPRVANRSRIRFLAIGIFTALVVSAFYLQADEPYSRTRDYDLQHSKIALRFDIEQRKVLGDVTHTLSILHNNISAVSFDSVGLTIQSVTVNKSPAKFETTAAKLIVPVPATSHPGDKYEIEIRYEGKPSKGLYFILPDKDDPDRPKQIWSQGESEDTRYYLPTLSLIHIYLPECIQQLFVTQLRRVKCHLHNFRVSGFVGAHVLIGWIDSVPAAIADNRVDDARNSPERRLDSPKATRAKCRNLCHRLSVVKLPAKSIRN